MQDDDPWSDTERREYRINGVEERERDYVIHHDHLRLLCDKRGIVPRIGDTMTCWGQAALSLEDEGLWPVIQRLERGCWSRKWSEVKVARKAIESQIGKRPHDPFWRTDVEQPK